MRLSFRLVDVFTDQPLAGNQLCVVPEPGTISSETMQAIAREIGFAETTFVTKVTRDRYEMRIFTPGSEIPFAGHPSLGTAYVLASEGRTRTAVIQSVTSGESPIEVDLREGSARMEQIPPIFRPPFIGSILEAAGLRPEDVHPELPAQVVSTGLAHLLVPAASEEVVRWAQPDPRRLGEVLDEAGGTGLYLFSFEEGRIDARMFAPGVGVGEDAATGSAAGPLGAYLVHHGVVPPGHLTIFQGKEINRPSTLEVDVEGEGDGLRVFVGGGVRVVGEGVFVLPD